MSLIWGAVLRPGIAVLGLAAMALGLPALASAAASEARIPTIYTRDPASFRVGGGAEALVERARTKGRLTVLVGLRIVTRMEHTLSPQALAAQRRALRRKQDGIVARVFGAYPPRRVDRFNFIPYMAFDVDAPQVGRLLADPDVASVHEDMELYPRLDDSVPLINADDVVKRGSDGSGWAIAVLDTGVDKTHPMLRPNKVVSEACYSRQDPPNAVSLCVDTDGRKVEETTRAGSAEDCAFKGCDHGTHVASIAAGNPVGALAGVAPGAKIIAIQINYRTTAGNLVTSLPNLVKGLARVYALRKKFKIAAVNISLGNGDFPSTCNSEDDATTAAITNLRAVGIPTLAVSGNDGLDTLDFPGCISNAIAVGNTTKQDLLWRSSNHNFLVKLLAPGRAIRAAIPGGGYKEMTGTSQAAPHVAAAFALLQKVPRTAATIDQILGALTCSGKAITRRVNPAGGDPIDISPIKPRIDVLAAYIALRKPANSVLAFPFDKATDAKDWTEFRGEWSVQGGNYRPATIPQWVASTHADCGTALQVAARMRNVDPSTGFTNAGIFLKASLDHSNKVIRGYFFAYNKAENPADKKRGQGVIYRADGYNLNTNSGSASLLCSGFVPIAVNGPNTLKVVSIGAKHSFSLNNKPVCTATDATYASGAVVLAAYNPSSSAGHSFAVDAATITRLPNAAPSEPDPADAVMDPTRAPKPNVSIARAP